MQLASLVANEEKSSSLLILPSSNAFTAPFTDRWVTEIEDSLRKIACDK